MEPMEQLLDQLGRRIDVALFHKEQNRIDGAVEWFRSMCYEHLAARKETKVAHDDTPLALLIGKNVRLLNYLEGAGVSTAGDFRNLEFGRLVNIHGIAQSNAFKIIAELREHGVELADFETVGREQQMAHLEEKRVAYYRKKSS